MESQMYEGWTRQHPSMDWSLGTLPLSEGAAMEFIKEFYAGTDGDFFCQAIVCVAGTDPNVLEHEMKLSESARNELAQLRAQIDKNAESAQEEIDEGKGLPVIRRLRNCQKKLEALDYILNSDL